MRPRNDATWLIGAGGAAAAIWWYARRADAAPTPRAPNTTGPAPTATHTPAARAPGSAPALLGFARPLPQNVRAIVSSGYTRPRGTKLHRALDIPVPVGTPVLAIDDGSVVRVRSDGSGDAGNWVGLLHPSGIVSRALHLSKPLAQLGQRVLRGVPIGLSGNTGNSEGPHLHLDLRAPAWMLPKISTWIGTPRAGWGPILDPYGFSIPGESMIPVEGYRDDVIKDARAAGVPLYSEVRHGQ